MAAGCGMVFETGAAAREGEVGRAGAGVRSGARRSVARAAAAPGLSHARDGRMRQTCPKGQGIGRAQAPTSVLKGAASLGSSYQGTHC